jgi:DNA-directed RNA polymerase specialized sigma24 family protein
MEKIKLSAQTAIKYYYPLLKRYAERITGNPDAAESIARKVLEDQYEINGLVPAKHLRQLLKTDVLNRCYYWQQSQFFVRPLIKIPFHALMETKKLDDDKNPLLN